MARRAFVPAELKTRPFTIEQARRAGLERWHLEGTTWRHLGHGLYAWSGLQDTPIVVLAAIQLRLPEFAAFSGRTAGWIHGLDMPALEPAEVTVPDDCGITATKLTAVRRAKLPPDDVVVARSLRVTSVPRTLCDLAARMPLEDAVVCIDTALRLRRVTVPEVSSWVESRRGMKGIRRFRRALELVDPLAESPMETRLRLLILFSGLPRPISQAELLDQSGFRLGRVDFYFPSRRLVVEYDGATHRETLSEDLRRQNGLVAAGFTVLRFTAADVFGSPASVVALIRAELARQTAA